MKLFLIKISIFLSLISISMLVIFFLADGYSDPFYLRFTSPKQSSLIIGTSRAAQGIQPRILNKCLSRSEIYNFAFTLGHSRFDPNYFRLIAQKVDTTSRDGTFIIAVDPWSLCDLLSEKKDSTKYIELELETNTKYTSLNPNIPYLLFNYNSPLINILTKKDNGALLHDDGWLEVSVSMDSVSVKKRLNEKLATYRNEYLKTYKYSKIREFYLAKTIKHLSKFGDVYLIRLPVHPEMMLIENNLNNNFNERMDSLANKLKIRYKDFTHLNSTMTYTDGNHLYKKSGANTSLELCNWINDLGNAKKEITIE